MYKLTLFHWNIQARSRSVQEGSSGYIFNSLGCCVSCFWYKIFILLMTPLTVALASSQPLFSINSLTRWRTVTAAGHLRYLVLSLLPLFSDTSFFDEPRSFFGILSSVSSSSCKLRLTRSSRVSSRAPTGGAKGGHCGFTKRKWHLRSSSDRKRPGTARYTSRWSRISGKRGGDVAMLHTGHARAPLLRRRTIQPLQTDDPRPQCERITTA